MFVKFQTEHDMLAEPFCIDNKYTLLYNVYIRDRIKYVTSTVLVK